MTDGKYDDLMKSYSNLMDRHMQAIDTLMFTQEKVFELRISNEEKDATIASYKERLLKLEMDDLTGPTK